MADLSLTNVELAMLIAALLLYGFIWFVTRNLSRLGMILTRLAPLGFVVPALIYLVSFLSAGKPDATPISGPGPETLSKASHAGAR